MVENPVPHFFKTTSKGPVRDALFFMQIPGAALFPSAFRNTEFVLTPRDAAFYVVLLGLIGLLGTVALFTARKIGNAIAARRR